MSFSVRRSLAWMMLSQAGGFLFQFGGSLVVARLLTPYDMGVFAVAIAVVGLISVLRSFGLASYLVRAQRVDEAMLASVFTLNAISAAMIAVLIVALSTLGGAFLHEPGVQRVLLVLAAVPLVGTFELLPATGIERAGCFREVAVISLCRSALSTAVMLTFLFSGFSYMSLAYGQLAGAVAGAAGFNLVGRRHARLRLGLQGWRDIARFGLHMLAISGVNVVSSRLAEIVLGRVLGLGTLGLYSRASGLNTLLWDNVHVIVTRVVFVDFSEQRRAGRSLRHSYLQVVQLITALLWPAFIGISVIAGPLILLLYGPAWTGAALPLSLLSLAAAVLVSMTMSWEIFVVCEETERQARFESVRAGVGFLLFAGGCVMGLGWAAAARVGEALFTVWLYRPHMERMTDTRGRDFVPIYLSSAALTLIAAGPAMAVMARYDWSPEAPLPAVLAGIAVGIVAWAAALVALRHPLAREGRRTLGLLFPRLA